MKVEHKLIQLIKYNINNTTQNTSWKKRIHKFKRMKTERENYIQNCCVTNETSVFLVANVCEATSYIQCQCRKTNGNK